MMNESTPLMPPWRPTAQKTYIFINASIVCPLTSRIFHHRTIKISNGYIESITDTEEGYTLVSHPHETTVDLSGKFLCPGLIDSHVHIAAVPGTDTLGELMSLTEDVGALRQPYICQQMLGRGFTTVRDCGGANLALKEAIEEGVVEGPRLFIAGKALSQTGGHGDPRGAYDTSCCSGRGLGLCRVCDGVPECSRAARDELRKGANFIKIMSGGGVASPTDKFDSVQFSAEEIRAISTVADSAGTYVTAHAYTPRSIRHAIDNGVTGIEHGNMIDEETARFMASKNIYLTPTLVTYAAMADPRFRAFIPAKNAAKNDGVLEAGLHSLRIANEAGVKICFGTDLLGPMTTLQSREFGLRARVLSSGDVLKSATVTPAKRLGIENVLGQIKAGFLADILILNKNPLDSVRVLDRPESTVLAVIKDGRVYNSRWTKLPRDIQDAGTTTMNELGQ
ncbi:hypothetical protein BJ875DRAFT_282485 [Amylocarpus encephaloides]|uniref:Amidohydrolase-related domain-containing protein n=1 Tax=Amylocarpus encephaloides TaxID=45428 RepID=A0A9P8C6A5_9HELO|nr:hypothetical protein BJ875DRAFT_282485 [Amylocarpus encephaloides]